MNLNSDPTVSSQVQCGLIVVAYKDGSPAHPHFMDTELCSQYWAKWLLRLEEYTKKEKKQNIQKPGQGQDTIWDHSALFHSAGKIPLFTMT